MAEHLPQMEKTEKTMAELEIDQNVKFEWDSITEAGAALKPLSGPGYASECRLDNHAWRACAILGLCCCCSPVNPMPQLESVMTQRWALRAVQVCGADQPGQQLLHEQRAAAAVVAAAAGTALCGTSRKCLQIRSC